MPHTRFGARLRENLPEVLDAVAAALCGEADPPRVGAPLSVRHTSALMRGLRALLLSGRIEVDPGSLDALGVPDGARSVDASPRLLLERVIVTLEEQIARVLTPSEASEIAARFAVTLPGLKGLLEADVSATCAGDPAARSREEVILCYPGVEALFHYRVAHVLHGLGVPLLPRLITEIAHGATGIDIHPGATIGAALFIDHGTGVVIGETAVIGDRVQICQGVTLGARPVPVGLDAGLSKGRPRHPVLEDDVIIHAGAIVLGRVTIGTGARIGGNVRVTHDVAPGADITQAHMPAGPGEGQSPAEPSSSRSEGPFPSPRPSARSRSAVWTPSSSAG